MWIIDPKNDKPSVTLTMFVLGFIIGTLKLLFSGINVSGFEIESFSGTDYAAVIGALGGIYTLRRMKKDEPNE